MQGTLKLLAVEIIGGFAVFALALFLAAGTVAWPAGWAFLALCFGFAAGLNLWLLQHNRGLLRERVTGIGTRGQKAWDKLFVVWAGVLYLKQVRYRLIPYVW